MFFGETVKESPFMYKLDHLNLCVILSMRSNGNKILVVHKGRDGYQPFLHLRNLCNSETSIFQLKTKVLKGLFITRLNTHTKFLNNLALRPAQNNV